MKRVLVVLASVFWLFVLLSGCSKEKECYKCVLCTYVIVPSESKEFCGKDAKDLGELWLTQKMTEAAATATNSSGGYETKTIELKAIANSKCTKQ